MLNRMTTDVKYSNDYLTTARSASKIWTMHVHPFVDEGLGHSSYVIDLGDGSAALIDPPRFPIEHERLAATLGLVVAWTIDTHAHADYVTGSPSLAAAGATFVAPAASRLATPHHGVADGDIIALVRGVELRALATPGHTPDHHAYAIELRGRAVALFSGGSLMVGAVGRTDLCGPGLAEPLAHDMYRSLHRFDDLPGDVVLYPTHGSGSFCSAPGASERTSTLLRERATNPLLAVAGEDEFVARLLAGFGTFPKYFFRLPELNRLGPTRYEAPPSLTPLSPADVASMVDAGALVVDVRPAAHFAEGHLRGSMSNTLRPVFSSWLGWLVEPDRPLVFVLDPDQDKADLVRQCLDVGIERLAGYLDGGIDAWLTTGRSVSMVPFVSVHRLSGTVVDVRQSDEFAKGHVAGAANIELAAIAIAKIANGPITVMCGHGERAMTAGSLLARRGRHDVAVFDGGPETWASATGQPLESGR